MEVGLSGARHVSRLRAGFSGWFLVGKEGMRALYIHICIYIYIYIYILGDSRGPYIYPVRDSMRALYIPFKGF